MRVRNLNLVGGLALLTALGLIASGCWNPMRRPPQNVFYGTREFDERAATLAHSKEQAFRFALEMARTDEQYRGEERLQYVSRQPTMLHGKIYVFSIARPDGASLKGYHVNGESGETLFYEIDEFIKTPVRTK